MEWNIEKAKAEAGLQARFIRKDKKVKGKWPMNRGRGNYHNNCGRDSKNSNNSTPQRVKATTTKVVDQAVIMVATIE